MDIFHKKKLGDVCNFTQGQQIASKDTIKELKPGYIRYIYIRDLFTNKYPVFVKDEYPNKLLSLGDIVMVNTGNTSGSVYKAKEGVLCNNAFKIAIKESKYDTLDKNFLWAYLNSDAREKMLKRLFNPAGQPHVGHKNVARLEIGLPPLPEQQKIAKILSTWDKAISTTEALIDNSKQQKKALMQQLLTGKKRFAGFEGEWEEVHLKNCVTFLNGKRKPIKQEERANIQGIYPYYGATGIIDYVNDFIFDEELILLGEDGENILSRALPHVFIINGKTWVNNHAHVLKANNNMNPTFLCMYLESLDYRKFNSGSAQPKLNKAVCEKIPVRVPIKEEQQKIASVLTNADKEIELLEQQLADLKQEKKALMQQLLTGKRRVKTDESEAVWA